MDDLNVKIGDLISVVPWDCEGVELPHGWRYYEKNSWDPKKKKMLETLAGKVKITPGSKALITGRETVAIHGNEDIMFWCLVEGQHLIVSHRFIDPV